MKLKVTFEIEGTMLADDVPLEEEAMEELLNLEFDVEEGRVYRGNRDIDTTVTNLKVEKVKKEKRMEQ